MKELYFEGAGSYNPVEYGDVTNCRIRAAFHNDAGDAIYLEMTMGRRNKYMAPSVPETYIHIDYCHYITDDPNTDDCNESRLKYDGKSIYKEWTLENIRNFIIFNLRCSIDTIKVLPWLSGYRVFASNDLWTTAGYNFADAFYYDEERTEKATAKQAELEQLNKKRFGLRFDNSSYWMEGNELVMRLNISEGMRALNGITERVHRFRID